MKRILIADDEESIRLTFAEFLRDEGYIVITVESLPECFQLLKDIDINVLFLDVNLGSENSIANILELKQIQPDCKIIMITGGINSSYITKAKQYGAMDYIIKPVRKASLLYATQKAVNQ